MVSPATLLTFSAATLAILLIPGPAVTYIVARSAAQGRRAGLVSVAGIHTGTLVHIAAAMAGLSAVLATSATAFTIVKLAGAAYLIWMGVQSLRAARRVGGSDDEFAAVAARTMGRVFRDGVVVNVLNPKTAVFFLSYVPQFVDPNAAHPVLTIAVLGATFIVLGLVSDSAYALAGGFLGGRLRGSSTMRRRKELVAGTTYLGLGAFTAVAGGTSS